MITKTINPIHFEDLEPHRFEDLVRQIIYDFRDWSLLEATGRLGTDDGFDARGWEYFYDTDSDEDDKIGEKVHISNLWLIQCKREKSITPAKMKKHLENILKGSENIYGIIFVAACDYSKKTRDLFISMIRERGIQEFKLLGKAELEDILFQPKYDHLLFAYFGVSLQIRKRSIKTKIRSRISTKKKIEKLFGLYRDNHVIFGNILLRNPEVEDYPFSEGIENFGKYPQWYSFNSAEYIYDGILFLMEKYYAFYDKDAMTYDFIEKNILNNQRRQSGLANIVTQETNQEWENLPEQNQFYLEYLRLVKYDNIIAIDENGDNYFEGTHLYVNWEKEDGPFESRIYRRLNKSFANPENVNLSSLKRIKIFDTKNSNK